MAEVCEAAGANVVQLADAIGHDDRSKMVELGREQCGGTLVGKRGRRPRGGLQA